jgi:hypothetical protein
MPKHIPHLYADISSRAVGWVELAKPNNGGRSMVVCVGINPTVPDNFLVASACCVGFRKLYPTYYSSHLFVTPAKPAAIENCEHAEKLQIFKQKKPGLRRVEGSIKD